MAADIKAKYGTSNQTITLTLASLANSSSRASTVVDNSSNLFLDALVSLNIKTGASGTASTGYVSVYAYGTSDGGTNYTEGATGSDAAITLVSPTNLVLIGLINCVANATTYKSGPMSVARAFGGVLPEKWGLVVTNSTGGALDSTESNHLKIYQGVLAQSV
jgi:hypothetical protein